MRASIQLLLLLGTMAQAEGKRTCTLEGRVTLIDGARVEATNQVVVYVEKVDASAWDAPVRNNLIVQQFEEFEPRLKVIVKGESVTWENKDLKEHSVFSKSGGNAFTLRRSRRGVTGTTVFNKPGPVRIQCDIHPWMRADVLVVQNPFYAPVGEGDRFRIEGLPAGPDYRVVAWEPNGSTATLEVKGCVGPKTLDFKLERGKDKPRQRKPYDITGV